MAHCHMMKINQCIFILFTIQVSHSLNTRITRQSCMCTKIYQPICGSDNKTYGNECVLKCANHENKKDKPITIAYPGECKEKDSCICPDGFQPVCGSNMISYNNDCFLNCASDKNIKNGKPPITVDYEGQCKDQEYSCICTKIYQPVCGSDNNTYSNECLLKCTNKENKEKPTTIAYEGECKKEDSCVCPFIYDPVCGSDMTTYNNECLLKCASKENVKNGKPPITVAYDGQCKEQEQYSCICPFIYEPVCGSNMITYGNKCVLKCASIKNVKNGKPPIDIAYKGQCKDQGTDSCICPFIYQRVCGSDNVTYGNKCVLKCASNKNVKNGKPPITIAYDGPCEGEDQDQECFCPFIYQPLCGSDMVTYNNKCLLKCASNKNIKNGKAPITIVYEGQCKDPDQDQDSCICSFISQPFCGSDMVTYSNRCLLKCASNQNIRNGKPPITIAYEGQCKDPDQDQDSCICSFISQPFCGSDMVTYSNRCLLKCASNQNIRNGKPPITIAYEGQCKDPDQDQDSCICSFISQPFCGSDMVTYSNRCLLKCASNQNIRNGKPPITIAYEGQCKDPNQDQDSCICSFISQPFCGSDMVTYSNRCLLKCASNQNIRNGKPSITIAYEGQCKDPDHDQDSCICSFISQPFCGSDMVTYSNRCVLKCASNQNIRNGKPPITIAYEGQCKDSDQDQDSCLCPFIYQPFCGSDMVTYSNEGLLKCASNINIKNGKPPITIAYEGKCKQLEGISIKPRNESCVCPLVDEPVCGTDQVTYKNVCFLKCASYNNAKHDKPPIFVQYEGKCKNRRSCICPDIYQPVCGIDGVTYGNECELDCKNLELEQYGRKPVTIISDGKCPEGCVCIDIYEPVCGSDGNTYANKCELSCKNKKLGNKKDLIVTVLYPGICNKACNCETEKGEVCGSDGQTYNNICELTCESEKLEKAGLSAISLHKKERCQYPCDCPNTVQPVCGSNHKSYKNYCILECVNTNVVRPYPQTYLGYNVYNIPNYYGNIGYGNFANDQYGHDIYKQNELIPYDNYAYGGYTNNKYKREVNDEINKDSENSENNITPEINKKSDQRENYENADQKQIGPFYRETNDRNKRDKYETDDDVPITVQYVGFCRDCFCFDIYSPVCGSDGNTYKNECQLNCKNDKLRKLGEKLIHVAYAGKCGFCYCPDVNIPVCGSDGNTYTNTCRLECENRKPGKGKGVEIKYLGVCHDKN